MKFKSSKSLYILLFYILLIFEVTVSSSQSESNDGVCVMRGVCGDTDMGAIPCSDKTEPTTLKQIPQNLRSLSLLEAMCPHLHHKEDPVVCCDEFQLESMFVTIYNLAHLGFNHCPSCLKNIEKLFCQMNCSPNQNKFIKVRKTKKSESGEHSAVEIDYHLAHSYAKGIFDSCKNVRNFEGNIMDTMCGGLKGKDCTVKDWLNYLGKNIGDKGVSPFKINFLITNETSLKVGNTLIEPSLESHVKCSEKPSKDSNACDCQHCPQSCSHNKNKRDLKREKRDSGKCLMKGICGETAFGAIPCVSNEDPIQISNPIALEELKEMCPHLATSDTPTVCCTEEQVIRLNQTFEMLSMFLKECPACVRNFEKVICHLSCATYQQTFMKITQTAKTDDQKEMVTAVEYFVNDDWAKGVYESCKGVHRLGFNVLDHYCKPYKAQDCDHQKFLQFIGGDAEHFGHSPFEINFIFTNDGSVDSGGVQYKPVTQPFYKCSDNPHTGEGVCPCMHCDQSCAPGEAKNIEKKLPTYSGKTKREVAYDPSPAEKELLESYLEDIAQELFDPAMELGNEYCIFDKTCRHDSKVGNVPCLKARKPIPVTDMESIEMLKNICPQLVDSDHPMTCCDSSFIHHMNAAFKLPAKLGLARCPSCMHNFRQILCQFACSPKQNQMIRVLNATKLDENILVEHLEYYINADFAQGLFDSCKSIHKGTVLNMMCGKWGWKKECTAQKWLDFMGLSIKKGGYSPFQMDVILTDESSLEVNGQIILPMNEKAFKCTESPVPGSRSCACADCQEACV